jgi:DNA-binding NarL/FixJ family response regulator
MSTNFERHRQAWTDSEISKLRVLANKGMSLQSIARALTRSEESVKKRAKIDKLKIAKAR